MGPTRPADRVEFEASADDRGDFVNGLMRADESSRLTGSSITPGRGQTTQDFAVGVGVFLIAIALVVALLPTFVTPFDAGSGGDTAKADRIAATIVDAAGGERPNELAVSTYEDSFVEASESELRRSLALTSVDAVNVSLVELESGTPVEELQLENDAPYEGQPAASVTRIVVLDEAVGGVDACDPACELTVRVW